MYILFTYADPQHISYSFIMSPQSILTVTFEMAGEVSEDALNVFIQVRALCVSHDFPIADQPEETTVLSSRHPMSTFQDLLWEKMFKNKEGQPMTVIRSKVP